MLEVPYFSKFTSVQSHKDERRGHSHVPAKAEHFRSYWSAWPRRESSGLCTFFERFLKVFSTWLTCSTCRTFSQHAIRTLSKTSDRDSSFMTFGERPDGWRPFASHEQRSTSRGHKSLQANTNVSNECISARQEGKCSWVVRSCTCASSASQL